MFFLKEGEREITMHPSFLGPNIGRYLEIELHRAVEGTTQGDYFIITVLSDPTYSDGRIIPGNGRAVFRIHYRAVCWKPFKGEVVDGIIANMNETGFFVDVGPLSAFVSRSMIPADIIYNTKSSPPIWTNDNDVTIEKGVQIRIRLKGVRSHLGSLFAIASINEDFLGPIPTDI